MRGYPKLRDYEEKTIKYKEQILSMACCDCGLVHKTAFHVYRNGILGVAHVRDDRATAQLRRHNYGNLQRGGRKYKLVRRNNA